MAGAPESIVPRIASWAGEGQDIHDYYVLDVFTSKPLEGNQLGLFLDGRPFDSEQMQAIAREMNFAETVFLLPAEEDGDARVRIFTPGTELPFAGHPLLGTAFAIGQAKGTDRVALETKQGTVVVSLEREGGRLTFGRMDQPIPTDEPFDRQDELFRALGVTSSHLPVMAYSNGPRHVYVALPSEQAVDQLAPDLAALREFDYSINCFAGQGSSWKTRMFAPRWGVPEDPATGSAAGPLAVHLARHGCVGYGDEIEIRQGFEIQRPSYLYARVGGRDGALTSVVVGGSALIVSAGAYLVTRG